MTSLILPARKPFNFISVVNSHGWVQLAPCNFEKGIFTYVDRLSNGRVLEYRISGSQNGLRMETENLDRAERKEVTERVSWMFALDADFSDFYRVARKEPRLRSAVRLGRGRVLRSPTLFEDVVKTLLTTNTLWGATKRMTLNLLTSFGDSLPGSEKRAFPTPEAIAVSSSAVLREKVRLGYRAEALHELAARVASDALDLESLKMSELPTMELRRELMNIKGIGPYAAANLLLILGRSDFIPIDSWALKLVSHEWYRGKPVTAKQVERRFERWGKFKGLAFWFWDWKYSGG
jgi:3-methyladenine DNA glycosylase/8-oxoguanine DNA glycosylase